MLNRRDVLKACAAAAVAGRVADAAEPPTAAAAIDARVEAARPLRGAAIPADIADRLGATHYGGKYHLTDEPFLLEGCQAIGRLGMRAAKLWLAPKLPGYAFNSRWNLPADASLVEVARHPYFQAAFALPFRTVALEIQPVGNKKFLDPARDFHEDEEALGALASHLYQTYADRPMTFILQHWEGDWMLRGDPRRPWRRGEIADLPARVDTFVRWLAARQRGVERARKAAGPSPRVAVYHAAEVNRVLDVARGLPTVTGDVLPRVAVDLVSWSSYDGMRDAAQTCQGIELIRRHARPSPVFGRPVVYIGEVGLPEQGRKADDVIDFWDRAMGVFLAEQIPWVFHWELYCNEPRDDGLRNQQRAFAADELRGFWLLRPDGSLGHAARYLKLLLDHAGGRLPPNARETLCRG